MLNIARAARGLLVTRYDPSSPVSKEYWTTGLTGSGMDLLDFLDYLPKVIGFLQEPALLSFV
jgi:hypothetical protein